jgi:thiamine-phosphate pyrophosphorylase
MAKIYLVGDKRYSFEKIVSALGEDVDYFQLRLKDVSDEEFLAEAIKYKEICKKRGIKFIINDRVDIAIEVDADGLHIGQDDLSLKEAKSRFKDKIIGVSCRSVDEALKAQVDGADYIGVGAIYETMTKDRAKVISLKGLKEIRDAVDIEIVAIGGIDSSNFKAVYESGADRLAVSSSILSDDNPLKIAKILRSKV